MLTMILLLVLALVIKVAVSGANGKITTHPNKDQVPVDTATTEIEADRSERIARKRDAFRELFENGFKKAEVDLKPLFLFIDFETTSLPPDYKIPSKQNLVHYPYIVQAASLVFNEAGELIDEFSAIIKVPDEIPFEQEAVDIHQITKKANQEQGHNISTFFDFIQKYCHDQVYVVAHNVQFDSLLLQVEAKRNSIKLPKYKKYCTMKSTAELVGIWNHDYTKYKNPKLRELVEYAYFDSEPIKNVINFHDAATDIKLCAMCFFELELDGDCESCN